jgi:hypothetical protein
MIPKYISINFPILSLEDSKIVKENIKNEYYLPLRIGESKFGKGLYTKVDIE